jgi:SAM-dependent methyltransferase
MPPRPTNVASLIDVLRFYASHSPPDHALWKTIEWRLFREYTYPQPVLDLGCGDGVFAELVFNQPLTSGIDIRQSRVRKARRAHVYDLAVTGDATAMPYTDESFATIFSGCAMEHVLPMPQLLAEIARILKPGGRLITTVPSGYFKDYLFVPTVLRRLGLEAIAAYYGKLIMRLLTMIHLYHPITWERLLADAGLELVEVRHFLPREATSLFDRLLIIGNIMQPLTWLLRGSCLHQRYVAWLVTKLLPYVTCDARTGGALLLVARKPDQ